MNWPHSPPHRLTEAGAYIVTAGTYLKKPIFRSAQRLAFLCETLLSLSPREGWSLHAWAVFPNHYHFVAESAQPRTLPSLVGKLHSITARKANEWDHASSRKVWFEYWETHITSSGSYYARLNYVHQNAVHHGLVRLAAQYPWCSAGWFERTADTSYHRRVYAMKIDQVSVPDGYLIDPVDLD